MIKNIRLKIDFDSLVGPTPQFILMLAYKEHLMYGGIAKTFQPGLLPEKPRS